MGTFGSINSLEVLSLGVPGNACRGLDPRATLRWASLTWLHLAHAHTAQFAEILVFKPLCVSNIFKTRNKLFLAP